MQFNTWLHPTTGEERIYVNGTGAQFGVKVFCVDGGKNGHYYDDFCKIVVKPSWGESISISAVDDVMDRVSDHIRDTLRLDRKPKFSDAQNLAQNGEEKKP